MVQIWEDLPIDSFIVLLNVFSYLCILCKFWPKNCLISQSDSVIRIDKPIFIAHTWPFQRSTIYSILRSSTCSSDWARAKVAGSSKSGYLVFLKKTSVVDISKRSCESFSRLLLFTGTPKIDDSGAKRVSFLPKYNILPFEILRGSKRQTSTPSVPLWLSLASGCQKLVTGGQID